MLVPWRITTERQREQAIAALRSFRGGALIWRGQPTSGASAADAHLQPLDDAQRAEVAQRLRGETDAQRDVWVASGRLESPSALYTLLHARVGDDRSATVDLLLSTTPRNNPQATAYDGFGEFAALTLTLERMNAPRFTIPIALDVNATGLTSAWWVEQSSGVFVFTRAPVTR